MGGSRGGVCRTPLSLEAGYGPGLGMEMVGKGVGSKYGDDEGRGGGGVSLPCPN